MKYLLVPALALGLLAGCATTPQQTAIDEVTAASTATSAAATAALAAHNTGLIHTGTPIENDITIALDGAKNALDTANAALHAGDTGSANFYLAQVAAFLATVTADLKSAGAK